MLYSFAILFVLSIAAVLLFGHSNYSKGSGDLQSKLDAFMEKKEDFSGIVLIAKDGNIIMEKGYGMANKEEGLPNQQDTKFQIASISKTFAATAIMQLEEKGLLSVQDPLSKYFPELPHSDSITLHHLLSHSSGYVEYLQSKEFEFDHKYAKEEIISLFKDEPLNFTPGEKFSYSNSGFFLLGMIVEKVSGQSYEDYIAENIFVPAGMVHSSFSVANPQELAVGYVKGEKGPKVDPSMAFAAGDIISTAGDVYLFDQALRANQLLKAETQNKMYTVYSSRFPYQYGYGWYVLETFGHRNVSHSGGYPNGFRNYLTRYIDEDLTIIVLSNQMETDSKALTRELASIVFGKGIWFWQRYL